MGFEKSDNIGFFSNPIILCNKKFCWNSLLHKKVLRARKRSSRRENVLLYYFRNANEKLFVLWHY